MRTLLLAAFTAVTAGAFAQAQTVLNSTFEGGIAGDGWTVYNTNASNKAWNWVDLTFSSANWDPGYAFENSNFVNTSTNVAYANSDYYNDSASGFGRVGSGPFNVSLQSPTFSLVGLTGAQVSYQMVYRHLTGSSGFFEISNNGGSSWTALKTYTVNTAANTANMAALNNGKTEIVNLSAYDGQANLNVRYRFADPSSFAWDWYFQVDNVQVTAVPEPGTMLALGAGLAAFAARRRRKA